MAASPLPSWGPTNGRKCYVTPTFSGVPNAKRGQKIRIGCLTPAFSGAHKWAEMPHNPAFSGVPKQRGTIKIGYLTPAFSEAHKWAEMLHNPCILRGPQTKGDKNFGRLWRHHVYGRSLLTLGN